ncbi:MAG: heparinase II/III family protein [Gammaproteobacteria bacterium]|nr:heparinase II/III family protein [Gammaproteobacteria bacterium]
MPYSKWHDEQLLAHFHQREGIDYRPQINPEHTKKAIIDAVLTNSFCFNNERYQLSNDFSWKQNPSSDIEWLIMLHKCYYCVGLGMHYRQTDNPRYLQQWMLLTRSWIEQTEPGFIASDVTGRRIQNWIFAFYYFVHSNPNRCVPATFLQLFLGSLHQQVRYLITHLSAARNHRTLELYAIFLAAVVFPEFKEASHWLEFSIKALTDNVSNDFLADGVHCELSTFYHHIVLNNLLKIKQLAVSNQIDFDPAFDLSIQRALIFSAYVHKPDGNIPSLSDGDTGCFYEVLERGYHLYGDEQLKCIVSQGKHGVVPKHRSLGFTESGYYILRSTWQTNNEPWQDSRYLIFDCGHLGAGNHGHLDLLNIEMAAYGRSLIVDPGRYTYDESGETNWRVRFRSTEYHNTVEVDGLNQIRYEYHPGRNKFKISGPVAEPEMRCFVSNQDFDYVHGLARSHEYSAIHERKIFFAAGEYWLICDYLDDDTGQEHDYSLRYHLSPEAEASVSTNVENNTRLIETPNLQLLQTQQASTRYTVESGFVSPQYGVKQAAPILRFDRCGVRTVFETLVFPYKSIAPRLTFQSLNQQMDEQANPGSSALYCRIQAAHQVVHDYYFMAHDHTKKHWKHDSIACDGSFCYLRFDNQGQLLNVFTLADSHIYLDGNPVQFRGEQR